ncbi:hypothetical protein LINPERPRIM_LOCUS16034, partial [Linum perenne]
MTGSVNASVGVENEGLVGGDEERCGERGVGVGRAGHSEDVGPVVEVASADMLLSCCWLEEEEPWRWRWYCDWKLGDWR